VYMGYVAACKQERNPVDSVDLLESLRKLLAGGDDAAC